VCVWRERLHDEKFGGDEATMVIIVLTISSTNTSQHIAPKRQTKREILKRFFHRVLLLKIRAEIIIM
jgi:hypothetical protein